MLKAKIIFAAAIAVAACHVPSAFAQDGSRQIAVEPTGGDGTGGGAGTGGGGGAGTGGGDAGKKKLPTLTAPIDGTPSLDDIAATPDASSTNKIVAEPEPAEAPAEPEPVEAPEAAEAPAVEDATEAPEAAEAPEAVEAPATAEAPEAVEAPKTGGKAADLEAVIDSAAAPAPAVEPEPAPKAPPAVASAGELILLLKSKGFVVEVDHREQDGDYVLVVTNDKKKEDGYLLVVDDEYGKVLSRKEIKLDDYGYGAAAEYEPAKKPAKSYDSGEGYESGEAYEGAEAYDGGEAYEPEDGYEDSGSYEAPSYGGESSGSGY